MRKLLGRAVGCALYVLSGAVCAAAVPLADLARHVQYDNVKISSDGRYLAATAVVKGKPMLALVDLTKGTGVMMKPREGNQVIDLYWANGHRVLYTEGTKVSGFDRPVPTGEIFAVNGDGTGSELLFGYRAGDTARSTHLKKREPERASAMVIDTLRDDENHVLISVVPWDSGADGAFNEIFALDVRDGGKRKVATAPLRSARFITDHHGVVRFAAGVDSQAHGQVYYREGEGKSWRLLFQGSAENNVPVPLAFNRDDSRVYMACDVPGKAGALCPWDVATQLMQPPVWTNATADISGLVRSLDRQDIEGVQSMPGTPTTEGIVAGSDAMKVISSLSQALPGRSVEIVSSTDDGSKVVALASSDLDPGTFYLWDAATGKASQLLQRAPWVKPEQMASKRPVAFKARDGMSLHGYLSMPPGAEESKHLPTVIYVHGGPFGVRDDWEFDPYVQMLATRGYAVLQVNYRGSGGYGRAFEEAGYREWGGKMQDDVTDATHWAIQQGIAAPDRICIFGGSYGGYAALEGAIKEPDLYRCAIGYVGVYDLPMMFTDGDISDRRAGMSYLRTTLGTDQAELAGRSPLNQLDRLKARVMLIVGGEDERVPPVQGQNLHAALQKRGVAHEWLYKSGEAHGFYVEENITELFEQVTQFLDRSLQGAAAP
ncbi:alpha/beta hydrolase family protein [Dyella japonica]|uniref:Prolyl oligopeptidase n=1 Tax=Dyella japonica A8 TaxID=1217721 RepID=A0A075K5G2_9GAMM|nr:S9 family peptidase [Dyella japonica]AIF47413.1 prolyl oligopeptidase [Dyella japonica A8]